MSRHTPSPTLGLPHPPEVSQALRDWAERLLLGLGAAVIWPEDKLAWSTPMEFYRKSIIEASAGMISLNAFYDRLHSPQMPKCPRRTSTTGRLLSFAPTPEAVRFLTAAPQNAGGARSAVCLAKARTTP